MGPKNNSLADNKISLQNNNGGEWDTHNAVILKQEIECDDVVELNTEERKPLIINFQIQTNCDDVLKNIPSKLNSEFPEISLENNQGCSIEKRPTVANRQQSIECEEEMYKMKLGTLQRVNLEELQKRKYSNEKQSASVSSKPELKKLFERYLDVHGGKSFFKCLYCEFQSIYLENMIKHINDNTLNNTESEMVRCHTYEDMKTQQRICGLCLEACDELKPIEGDMKDALDAVLPNIDSTGIQERVVCTHCTQMVRKYSDFKAACLYTYNYIVSFANNRDNVKLNLKDIYLSKDDNCTGISEDEVVCGFCMGLEKSCSAISLDVEEGDVMLEVMKAQCLPELDLSLIEKPVVCGSCHHFLENCFSFMTNCLAVEEKIQKYCENLDVNIRDQTELNSLLQFTTRDETTNKVNGNLVDIIKEEKPICEEKEDADDRKIDTVGEIFKSEPLFCIDNKSASKEENKKLEIDLKEESHFELDNEEIEIKTDEQDFNRFENEVVLPQPNDTTGSRKVTLHRCDSCSYQAKRKDHLRLHQLVHKNSSEVTMHKCDSCSYQTKLKNNLRKHSLVHRDPAEVPMFNCETCSYQTKYKQGLKMHLLQHRSPSEITIYGCDTCSYQTKSKQCLKMHLLKHRSISEITIYKCDSCSFQTKQQRYLRKHAQIHKSPSEVTFYKCDSCLYQTRFKSSLRSHKLVHKSPSEIPMYKCEFCSFQTKRTQNIKAHVRSHK